MNLYPKVILKIQEKRIIKYNPNKLLLSQKQKKTKILTNLIIV